MPEKQKENINDNKLSEEDKSLLLAEIKNIIKKVDEQNMALGKIINKQK